MASYLSLSGIIRIRDMMYSVADPYRLDQGDVSFDAPDSVKKGMARAIADNHSHYVQTTGIPRLRELIAEKLRHTNGISIDDVDEVLVTNGGIHGLYIICLSLLDEGDEVLIPDPEWPPAAGNILAARGVPVGYRLHEANGWRPDLDEIESKITPRTRILYLNSPNNPTGGVLTRASLERLAAIAVKHNLWVISDEAYEDVVFDGEHVSIASLPDMDRPTTALYTFSKSYAMTGLRLGYIAIANAMIRDRAKKILFYTASNVASIVQCGGIGALEDRSTASRRSAPSCAPAGICSTRASRSSRAMCSRASHPPARSTRSCGSIRRGAKAIARRRPSRGGWSSISLRRGASAACRASISGRTAKATSGSASRATAKS